jgi:hypothetical protein
MESQYVADLDLLKLSKNPSKGKDAVAYGQLSINDSVSQQNDPAQVS